MFICRNGEKGALGITKNDKVTSNAISISPVDSVGAGDAFNGALAVGLSKDLQIKEVLTFANKVAAISTTKKGAAASMPSLEDIKSY